MNFSVIVPVYNGEKYLKQCIESIRNQQYRDFEVVLVDDGSTDLSGKICNDIVEYDERFRVIHKKNEGLICARRDGIAAANGQWIAFVDADDWVDKNFLGILFSYAEKQNIDLVAAGCTKEKDGKQEKVWNGIASYTYTEKMIQTSVFPRMLYQDGFFKFGILPYMWNKLFKKDLLSKCYEEIDTGIYDGEDVAVLYPYILSAKNIAVIDETGYHYRIHSNTITTTKRKDYYENVSRLYLHLDRQFKKTTYYEIMLPQLCQYMRMMAFQGSPESFIESQKYIFPFDKVYKGAKIILYGAGNVGRTYCYQVRQLEYCSLVAWVDKNKAGTYIYGIPIEEIARIAELTYDFIVVAVAEEKIKKEIYKVLSKGKVNFEKVII